MFFAAGGADPTPACSITINGTVTKTVDGTYVGTYGGSDPCEGTFEGTMAMARRP